MECSICHQAEALTLAFATEEDPHPCATCQPLLSAAYVEAASGHGVFHVGDHDVAVPAGAERLIMRVAAALEREVCRG
jgi:hypothetical protein